ncbi:putative membrane spanning protein [Granulibacter bethesdensis]|uniref:Membrane spanning protein n=2 Tax=Granulibacter bethesdensis TaxID=364410 RepID=A0AAC9KAG0_9PROT|nr:putative membrane spanning protein [Granulibacter bethesdensis]APH61051.1 putative membrane spanning protein [Granulibacter bethesdensis]
MGTSAAGCCTAGPAVCASLAPGHPSPQRPGVKMRKERYAAMAALKAVGLSAAALTALFSLLEFVQQLASVGQGRYGMLDATIYVALTAPYRLLQVVPVSMLIGTLLGLGGLARNGELTALRGLGMSERRIILSVIAFSIPLMVILFLMAQFVIPPAQREAQTWRSNALPDTTALRSQDSFWAYGDRHFLNVQHFEHNDEPYNIDIFSFAVDGELHRYLHAQSADIMPNDRWVLHDVLSRTLVDGQLRKDHLDRLDWTPFLTPQQTQFLRLRPDAMPPLALWRYVSSLKQRGLQAIRYEQELWAKISIPLTMMAMVIAATPFVFGGGRVQNTGAFIALGAAIGVVFTLVQQISGHLDVLLNLNPAVTALTPPVLLMWLGIDLFYRRQR